MNCELRKEIADLISELFADGNTPSKKYGIDDELIERVELQNPHVSKQYPWHAVQPQAAA